MTLTRILIDREGKYVYQRDKGAVSTRFGSLSADAINSAADGTELVSNTGERFTVITPTWLDRYRKIERGPQIMLLKDIGVIALETGIGPDSLIAEAGTGSGAAALALARISRHVHSFDVVQEHHDLGKRNALALGTTNVTFHVHDIYASVPTPDGPYDVLLLDNPEPWRVLPHLDAVVIGGWIVGYLPSINQAATFSQALIDDPRVQYRKTVELIEREWAIKGLRVRPSSDAIGHTGFLVYGRRMA